MFRYCKQYLDSCHECSISSTHWWGLLGWQKVLLCLGARAHHSSGLVSIVFLKPGLPLKQFCKGKNAASCSRQVKLLKAEMNMFVPALP